MMGKSPWGSANREGGKALMKPQRGAMFVAPISKQEKELRRSGIVPCRTRACPCRTYGAQGLISWFYKHSASTRLFERFP